MGAKEHKTVDGLITEIDETQGIVTAIFAVMGNVDSGGDRIHPGAFTKTFAERGSRVRILDHHNTFSVRDAIAKPLRLREVGASDLPPEALSKFPEATGGAELTAKFMLDDDASMAIFRRIKEGVVNEWSFGYDPLDFDYSKEEVDGQDVTVRNLRTLRLWEVSPVLWGMNEATSTTGVKDDNPDAEDKATEEKPWDVFVEGDQYCVYKINEDGEAVGESLGCHDTEDEAVEQIQALYAAEENAKTLVPIFQAAWAVEQDLKRLGELVQAAKEGRVLSARNGTRIANAVLALVELLEDAGIDVPGLSASVEEEEEDDPGKLAADSPFKGKADPAEQHDDVGRVEDDSPSEADMLTRINLLEAELKIIGV